MKQSHNYKLNELTKYAALLIFILYAKLYANDPFQTVYISPVPGSITNSIVTNLIIRTNKPIDKNSMGKLPYFEVKGSSSGLHQCEMIIADDGKTLLFNPLCKFDEGETVFVQSVRAIVSAGGEMIDSIKFAFSTVTKAGNTEIYQEYIATSGLFSERALNKVHQTAMQNLSTDSLPDDFPSVDITISDNPHPDYMFLGTTAKVPYIMILDNSGNPIFYKKTPSGTYDFKVQPNGLLTYFDLKSSCFLVMDSTYNVIDSFKCGNGYYTDLHELRLLPNGHALIIGFIDRVIDLSRLVEGGFTDAVVVGSIIQELDKNKNVIFQWRCQDYFNVTDSYADLKQNYIDYTHANAIDVDDDGNLLISFRNMQEITKINRQTGKIIWRFGGRKNQFSFINDNLGFSWQHAIRRLPNGNYLLFDNGFKREKDNYSRVLEYKLNENLKTADLVWQYRNNPDIYSYGLGYAQRLNNGNTFICWGTETPSITEVRPDGTKAFEMSLPSNLMTYRAYRFPWMNKNESTSNLSFSMHKQIFNPLKIADTSSVELEIRNNEEENITINSITNNSESFYTPAVFPVKIIPEENIKIRFYFKPVTFGSSLDTFRIHYNNVNEEILLMGESPFPLLKTNKNILDFGDIPVNGIAKMNLELFNSSINTLTIFSFGKRADEFSFQLPDLPYYMKEGDTLKIPVSFEPVTSGFFSDTIIIKSNSEKQVLIFLTGKAVTASIVKEKSEFNRFYLSQNFPNPFNQSTVINYEIARTEKVNLSIYNMLGELVSIVVDQYQEPGRYSISWNGTGKNGFMVNSGLYIYSILAGDYRETHKMLMLK